METLHNKRIHALTSQENLLMSGFWADTKQSAQILTQTHQFKVSRPMNHGSSR